MTLRLWIGLALAIALLASMNSAVAQTRPFALDEIVPQYPEGYTRVLAADIAVLLQTPALNQGLMNPLAAARHPLNGIRQAIELFKLDLGRIPWVAHGAGPNLSSFSAIHGAPAPQVLGALQGLKAATGAPGSPYQEWEQVDLGGVPAVFIGAVFGPIPIQYAYLPLGIQLWFGTEIGLGGPPNKARLRESAHKIAARLQGRGEVFGEFVAAYPTRGGTIAYVRLTDSLKDKPVERDEEAMSYSVAFDGTTARVRFHLRFLTEAAASAAHANLRAGRSPYLAQDLYRAELIGVQQSGRFLDIEVRTDLRGVVGLLVLTMPL
ncbi:MAG: hypothetical protein NZ610_06580 [Candidatus Bipolaricaulota bacterium]|nr:hypothetical protein [Candidatus Bipolaricaulota bacterium]MCS7275043.1 hypothetical protein [Candidatus Bipolaricaulota bacterium]MDW8110371.1 hypothetical protein [Candidatus Bipolaricaulota bacterium]MDW8328733.1 hypothetical protein [Candidatus Bipolaricaulota bacterium]